MMRAMCLVVAVLISSGAHAQHADHHDNGDRSRHPSAVGPPILLTINPEARVSVARGGDLPPPRTCGEPVELTIHVVNQGFVTAPLVAELLGDGRGASVHFAPFALTGAPQETRVLHVIPVNPGATDLTLAFRTRRGIPDLGGRDRIHLLIRCE